MRISQPYATMVFVAIYVGLRVRELIALRWVAISADTITVDEPARVIDSVRRDPLSIG